MNRKKLVSLIQERRSLLCVGLDLDPTKIPPHLLQNEDALWQFNKAIIDATKQHCVAYKPNLAFYEALGLAGWQLLQKTVDYIGDQHFLIADAKRGDIGNTSSMYAKAFFEQMPFDSVTVAPYMGRDSVEPFLQFPDKWAIVLALTSNTGSQDFQHLTDANGQPLWQHTLQKCMSWGTPENMMFVVGATNPEYFQAIRRICPEHFLLVPGIGAQGGDLESVCRYGLNKDGGLLINASRSIIYASNGKDFAERATQEAIELNKQIAQFWN